MRSSWRVFVGIVCFGLLNSVAAAESPTNIITVAKSGGDTASLAEAFRMSYDASASNKIVIDIAPGSYSLRRPTVVPPYVHIQGRGSNLSTIVGSVDSGFLLTLSPFSSIKDLKIVNKTGTRAETIKAAQSPTTFSLSRSVKIENSEIVAQVITDASTANNRIIGAVAIEGDNTSIEVINSLVKAFASSSEPQGGKPFARGIGSDTVMFLKRSVVSVAATSFAHGVTSNDPANSKVVIEDSRVIVKAENDISLGLAVNNMQTIVLLDSLISANTESVDGLSWGIVTTTLEPGFLTGSLNIRNSIVTGGTAGIVLGETNLSMKRSTLVNGIDTNANGVITSCLLTDDGKGRLLNSVCQN